MESFFGRYKNALVLMAVLFVQIIVLATQVKRPSDPKVPNSPGTRLIRVWAVTAFAPLERAVVGTGHFFRHGWHNYVDLHGVREQNQQLQAEITRLRMEEVRLREDAQQGQRLQALLGFREKFVSDTMAAQVIGTSGSEQSRVIYIDKGQRDGIRPDMAVITPDGIVGKVKDVFPLSSQVLMITDHDSGAGVILEKSRLQGVLRGTAMGELQVDGVMADQNVSAGDQVVASGGDRIYPKGLPVGTVASAAPDRETGTFLSIKIKPAADLNRLEEVLVVTRMAEQVSAATDTNTQVRAADILAQRLPGVPKTPQTQPATPGATTPDNKKPEDKTDDKKKEEKKKVQTAPELKNPADASSAPTAKPKSGAQQSGALKNNGKPAQSDITTQQPVPENSPETSPAGEKKTPEPPRPTEKPPR